MKIQYSPPNTAVQHRAAGSLVLHGTFRTPECAAGALESAVTLRAITKCACRLTCNLWRVKALQHVLEHHFRCDKLVTRVDLARDPTLQLHRVPFDVPQAARTAWMRERVPVKEAVTTYQLCNSQRPLKATPQ